MIQNILLHNDYGKLFADKYNIYSSDILSDVKSGDIHAVELSFGNGYQSFQKKLMQATQATEKQNYSQLSYQQENKKNISQENKEKIEKNNNSLQENKVDKQKDSTNVSHKNENKKVDKDKKSKETSSEQETIVHMLQEKKNIVKVLKKEDPQETDDSDEQIVLSEVIEKKTGNAKSLIVTMADKNNKSLDRNNKDFVLKKELLQKTIHTQENDVSTKVVSDMQKKEISMDAIDLLVKESEINKDKKDDFVQEKTDSSLSFENKESSIFSQLEQVVQSKSHKKKNQVSIHNNNKKFSFNENTHASSHNYNAFSQQISLKFQENTISHKVSTLHNAQNQMQNFIKNDFMKQARLLIHPNSSGEIKIALQPRELGDIKYNIKLDDNSISAKVVVESDAVKELVLKSIDQLYKQFLQEGYEIGNFTVSVDSKNAENNTNDENESSSKSHKDKEVDLLRHVSNVFESAYVGVSERINLIA